MRAVSSDPLTQLAHHLAAGRTILPWVIKHAPDGDLSAAWLAATRPHVMLRVLKNHPRLVDAIIALQPWGVTGVVFVHEPVADLRFDVGEYQQAWIRSHGSPAAMLPVHTAMCDAIRAVVPAPRIEDVVRSLGDQ